MKIPALIAPPKPSSNVLGIAYDKTERVLYINFRSTGLYAYSDVPPKTYDKLLAADSIGRFIGKDITPNHFYKKVKQEEIPAEPPQETRIPEEGC